VRPHHRFGTVEVRICDAQTEAWQSLAISSLTVGLIAHLARVYDEGMPLPILPTRYIEENLWRAIRYGMDGKLVDWAMGEELTAADAIRHLVEISAPQAEALGPLGGDLLGDRQYGAPETQVVGQDADDVAGR